MGAASGTQTNTQRQRGGRRRVTRVVLRLVTVVFVIGLALVMTLYVWATRPARLREAVTGVFDRLHGAHAVVGDVSFTPWDGLSVERLRIVYDESREATQPVRADQLPPIADVGDAHIRCDWRALLTGRFEPTEIRANSAQINAIHDVSGLNSLDILPEEEPGAPHHARHYLPFAIEHVDVNLWTVADGALRLSERWRLAARGEARQPAVRQGDYVVRLHPVGEPLTSLAELKLGAADSVVDLSVNWLSLRTAKLTSTLWPTAGDRVRQILDQFDLRGEVQLTRLRATGTELTDISIALRGVSGSLPIEAVSNADGSLASLGPEQRFLRFTDGTGTLQLRDIALDGRVTVLLNGEPATLSLSCIPPADAPVIEFGGAAPAFERWGVTIDARLTRVAFPTRTEQPDFVESPRLPHSVRAFFRDYDPHGDFEFEVSATRPPGDADESTKQSWDYEARVAALGASCSYYRFPLLVDDIQGGFRVRNNVIAFTDLTARHGAGRIYVSGTLDEPRNWTGFDLRFRAANMPLDENLYEALSPMYRRLWDDARPIGLCDLDVELSRGPGSRDTGPSPTDTRVTARLLAGSVAFDHQRLGHCDGVVTIEHGVITAHGLRGTYGPASVYVSGRAAAAAEGVDRQWRFDVGDLPIDETIQSVGVDQPGLAGSGPSDVDNSDSVVRFQGRTDVWGRQQMTADATQSRRVATIRINDGRLSSLDGTQTWQQARGWLVLDDDKLELHSFTCANQTGTITASGTMDRTGGGDTHLTINTASEDMGDLVRQVVPARWSRVAQALGLQGRGSVTLRYGQQAGESPKSAGLELSADQMCPAPLPLQLRNVSANLALDSHGFDVQNGRAEYSGGGQIGVTGSGEWADGRTPWRLNVEAEDVPINDDLIAAMPEGFRALLQRMNATGRLRVPKEHEISIASTVDDRWQISGVLLLSGAELNIGLELKEFDGRLETQRSDEPTQPDHVVVGAGGTDATVAFHISTGTLADRPLKNCDGTLRVARDQDWVRIDEVSGWFCGGEMSGFGKVRPSTGEYQISVTLHDLSYDDFFKPHLPSGQERGAARLDGRVFLRGTGHNASTRRGGGTLRIRGASILHTPVLASVAELSKGTKRRITNNAEIIELEFDWVGSVFHITRIDIRAGGTHLVGKGRWNIQSNAIALTLVAAPSDLALVPPFSLLDIAREELAQYRVSGTLSDAKVTLEPLHNVAEALRDIVERGPARDPGR